MHVLPSFVSSPTNWHALTFIMCAAGLIGTRYRRSYRQRGVGMSWNTVSLACLQACAVALGGPSVAALCFVFCVDYKQFGSGAPDLLTIRAVSAGPVGHICPGQSDAVFNWEGVLGAGWGEVRVDEEDPVALSLWDDEDMLSSGRDGGRRRWGRRRYSNAGAGRTGEECSAPDIENGRRKRATAMETFFERRVKQCEQLVDIDDVDDEAGDDTCEIYSPLGDCEEEGPVDNTLLQELDAEEEHVAVLCDDAKSGCDESGANHGERDVNVHAWMNPFMSDEPDIELPDHPLQEAGFSWRYECLLVEVKGPTDRLSDTQQRWIQILNSNKISAIVCRVKEGVMNLQSGHHQTSGRVS